MKPISVYCRQEVEGWVKLPSILNMSPPGEEDYSCGFLNQKEGMHLLASVKNLGVLHQIHVTIGPIMAYCKNKTEEEMATKIASQADAILENFFGDLDFCRAPDERRSSVKHFFHIIDKE